MAPDPERLTQTQPGSHGQPYPRSLHLTGQWIGRASDSGDEVYPAVIPPLDLEQNPKAF